MGKNGKNMEKIKKRDFAASARRCSARGKPFTAVTIPQKLTCPPG